MSRIRKLAGRHLRTAIRLIQYIPDWPGEYFGKPPIIILSFNRPDHLRATLESLRQQTPPIEPERIHLFQDGPVNPYSGVRYAADETIEHSIRVFQEIFPQGRLHLSKPNLGICENFLRAERFAFMTLKAPVGYFFEDDMVLSPHYVGALDMLRRALCGRRVGYFNACGAFTASLKEQAARHDELIDMGHLWGFGLKRSHWRAMQPKLEPYYRLVVGKDYRDRPHEAIFAYFRTLGISHPSSSQDAAKIIATHALGRWQASTFPCFAEYIGKEGTHFTEAKFEAYGLHRTTVFIGPLRRVMVTRAQVRAGMKRFRTAFRRFSSAQMSSPDKEAKDAVARDT